MEKTEENAKIRVSSGQQPQEKKPNGGAVITFHNFRYQVIVGPLSRVRPRNGILCLVVVLVVVVLPLRSEFIGEL